LARRPVDDAPARGADDADGSCMVVVATDAPLDARNLCRLAARAFIGLARTGGIAFPLAPRWPGDVLRVLLTPATVPDVFLQLGQEPVHWTDYTRWYLCDWRENERWESASPAKQRQLAALAAGAARGHVVYPLAAA
jgi:hypothetical protein